MNRWFEICSACILVGAHGTFAWAQEAAGQAGLRSSAPADALAVCKTGDSLTEIPVWQPTVDQDDNLSSDPPAKDGQTIYIALSHTSSHASCNDQALVSFSRPKNVDNFRDGGLAVNIQGNTRFADGVCRFSGFYTNKDVPGMHQGWIETYFGAIDAKHTPAADKFCLGGIVK